MAASEAAKTRAAILIVDDRADKLLALEALLSDLDLEIVASRSGAEALRCLLQHEFAVILLDVNMPGMDGFETAALIRGRKSSEHTPIIFITAYTDETHVSRGYSLGAVDYIQAAIDPEILRTKVSVFVDLFQMTQRVKQQTAILLEREKQLQDLALASLAINSALSIDELLRVVCEAASRIIDAHQSMIAVTLPDEPARRKECLWLSDKYAPWRGADGDPPTALERWLAEGNGILRKEEKEIDPLAADSSPDQKLPVRGLLVVPLATPGGHRLGAIGLSDRHVGDFTADDQAILVQLAQMASIAIENTISAKAREANRLKDEFLALVSHELRTPLSAISGWVHLLRGGELDNRTTDQALDIIKRNVDAQTKLINDLLDVSRIVTGKFRLNLQPMRLPAVVEAAVEAAKPIAAAKGVELRCASSSADLVEIQGDSDRLQQVMRNLLDNAIHFTPQGGKIEVRTELDGRSWRVSVQDTGEGIHPDFLPYVFERFRQADSSTTRAHGGLGVGLALVRHVIELLGGSVEATSPGLGKGTTFRFTLPAAATSSRAVAETRNLLRPNGFHGVRLDGLRILVVDDDPDVRNCLQTALAQSGARAAVAASAREALAAIEAERPDVLVSDIAMPDCDGYELIREVRMREGPHTAPIPALALTAYAGATNRARALREGFQEHLAKPIDLERLLAMVADLAATAS